MRQPFAYPTICGLGSSSIFFLLIDCAQSIEDIFSERSFRCTLPGLPVTSTSPPPVRMRSITSRRSPLLSKPKNPTWSRAGAGLTGLTRDDRLGLNYACTDKRFGSGKKFDGLSQG